ncbi:MAG TPA: UDP-glucose 4-epimerase GalE, partial [Caulobacteraceae bacterium]
RLEGVIGRPVDKRAAERRAGDPPILVADPAKLRRLLDWTPAHDDIDEILKTALAWQRGLNG